MTVHIEGFPIYVDKSSTKITQRFLFLIVFSQVFLRGKSPKSSWCPLRWRHNGRDGAWNHQPLFTLSLSLFTLFTLSFILVQIKENIKASRHWPLWAEFTGDRWIPHTMASNAENVSIWWRHHGNHKKQAQQTMCIKQGLGHMRLGLRLENRDLRPLVNTPPGPIYTQNHQNQHRR